MLPLQSLLEACRYLAFQPGAGSVLPVISSLPTGGHRLLVHRILLGPLVLKDLTARLITLVSLGLFASAASATVCDVDDDGDIDRLDIGLIAQARNQPAEPGDPRDADGDGVITVLDGRQCVLRCTLARCAIVDPGANSAPVSNAGPDQAVSVGDVVQLSGSASSDADGDMLSYNWVLLTLPTGSGAALSDPAAESPQFTVDVAGSYVAQLIVNDGTVDSAPDNVQVVTENTVPVADAGADQAAPLGEVVTLDGSGSSDADNDPLLFSWTLITTPTGSLAAFNDPNAESPSFTLDVPGTYVAELMVNDGAADSAPDQVQIDTLNSAPTADAGPDQTVPVGTTVTLSGGGSNDPDNDALTYTWALTSVPADSLAELNDPAAAAPTFTVDVPGTYFAQLIVNDGTEDSAPDEVQIVTGNTAPVADAGPDQIALVGATVTLNGAGSNDVDNDPLTFAWALTTVPAGSLAALNDPAAPAPTFTVDLPGTYVAQLIVNDGTVDSASDEVQIVTGNTAPVADAGPDQVALVGATVTLNGAGSNDVDNDTLAFAWALTTVPAGSLAALNDPTAAAPTFTVDVPGTYVAQLIVNDGTVDSASDEVQIVTGNTAPVADAGPDQVALVGATVTLNGAGSNDVDNDTLAFAWSLTTVPAGSLAALNDPAAAAPTFTADVPGTYVAQLIVNDGTEDSASDEVQIVTENAQPVADAGPDQTVLVGDVVTLNGTGSNDAEGDPLTFTWTLTTVPVDSLAALNDPAVATPVFTVDVPGTYVAQLIVNDGTTDSAPDEIQIVTGNSAPVANAGASQTVSVDDLVTLDGSGSSDPDGDPLTFIWSFSSQPAASTAALVDAATETASFTPDVDGTYVVELIVNDGTVDSQPATATILAQVVEPTLELTITEPAAGAFINQDTVTVRGTVTVLDSRVTVQDDFADVTGNDFEAEIALFEGPNDIIVQARSPLGADATTSLTITVDTTPPALSVSSPVDRSIVTGSPITVTGSVFDVSAVTCTVNGVDAPVDQAVFDGTFVVAEGANGFTVDCEDAAGNVTSGQRTVFLDGTPMQVVAADPQDGALGVPSANPVSVTFSEAADPASVGQSNVYLGVGAGILSSDVALAPDGLTATLTPGLPLPSGVAVSINVTTGVTNADGIPLSAPFASTFTVAGAVAEAGVVIGQVFDDATGLPVADAPVSAASLTDGSILANTLTDERGRYLLEPGQADVLVRVTVPGFTESDRRLGPAEGGFAEVLDARITPLNDATTVQAVLGGEIGNEDGDLLRILPGAIAADAGIRFSAISGQGPQSPFPPGWTPIAIAAVDTPAPFTLPATIEFGDLGADLNGRNAVVAGYNVATATWIALENLVLTGAATAEFNGVNGSGQFALVVADTDVDGPAPVVVGSALTAGTVTPIPETATATGDVDPSVGRGDDPTPAAATVTITGIDPLRSGSIIRGDFMEIFLLRDGDRISPFDRSQDIIAYRSPAVAAAETTVTAEFPVAPSQTFDLVVLNEGTVTVTLSREQVVATNIVGAAGGGIQIDDGSRVTAEPGALTNDVPLGLMRVGSASFPPVSAPSVAFVGGLELDLSGAQSGAPLTLSLAGAAALVPTGSQVVVAETRTVRDRQALVLVAVGIIQGDALTTATTFGGVTLPGIRNGGRYGFFRIDGPLEVVPGTARDEADRLDGHVIELDGLPFVSITDATGAFALVSPPGEFTVIATGAEIADQVQVDGNTTTALPDIVIAATPPTIESVLVRLPRIEGNFAGPLALLGIPAPVIDDSIGGDGDGQIEAGETIALTLSVRNDGTIPIEEGSITVQIEAPTGPIDIAPSAIAFESLPPDEPFTVGPLTFTVPANVDPAQIRYTLIQSNAGGFANVIPFDLPLDVDHPRVPLGSEITVQFSEAVNGAAAAGAILLERDDPAGPQPVSTNVLINADRNTATIRPLAELADDSNYTVTLNDAITDDDNRPLDNAPIVQSISTEDRTPPEAITPGEIEASTPDEDGFVTITGSPGTVNLDDVVIVLNQTTGVTVLATVNPDGSFEARIQAEVSDLITIIVRDRNDNETTIDISEYVNRDPVTGEIVSTVIGSQGGTINGPGELGLTIPTGALIGTTEISVEPVNEPFELPADLAGDPDVAAAFDAAFTVVARVQITADSGRFGAPIGLTLPAPAGSIVGDLFILARSQVVTIGGPLADLDRIDGLTALENPIQTVQRLEIVETATVKDMDGELQLSTDSPPFAGITGPGVLSVISVNQPLTFFAGQVRKDSVSGVPVPDALVTSLPGATQTSVFAATTDGDGRFVVADANIEGAQSDGAIISGRLDVRDPYFDRVIRRDVRGEVRTPSPPATSVAHLTEPFVLPVRIPQQIIDIVGDLEPPTVVISIDGQTEFDRFVRVGEQLNVVVSAQDDDEISQVRLELDEGFGFSETALDNAGIVSYTPTADAVITFRASARDRSGNVTFADLQIRAVDVAVGSPLVPTPAPGSPRVLVPPTTLTPMDQPICLLYSEPINPITVTDDSVQLRDASGNRVRTTSLVDFGNARVCAVPYGLLTPGETYRLQTAGVVDTEGEEAEARTDETTCPSPVLLTALSLSNVEDVAVSDDAVLVLTSTDSSRIGDNGKLNVYRLQQDSGGTNSAHLELFSSLPTLGRPLSLAVDGSRVYVANRFLGAIASKNPHLTWSFQNLATLGNDPELIGCTIAPSPTSFVSDPFDPVSLSLSVGGAFDVLPSSPGTGLLLGSAGTPLLCASNTLIENAFPAPPSNVEIFDVSDLSRLSRVGSVPTNNLLKTNEAGVVIDDVWDPNTWPQRLEVTPQGVAVAHFLGNIELFSRNDRPRSVLNIGPIRRYGQLETSFEVTDAAFYDGYAVVVESSDAQVVSTLGALEPPEITPPIVQEQVNALSPLILPRSRFVGAVSDFEWIDQSGNEQTNDLAFVSTFDDEIHVIDVTDPTRPFERSVVSGVGGRMSFDSCRGAAYVHGDNGEFTVVDFNDPNTARSVFSASPNSGNETAGSGRSTFNGNTNSDGTIYLARESGVSVWQMAGSCAAIRDGDGSAESSAASNAGLSSTTDANSTQQSGPSLCPIRLFPQYAVSRRVLCLPDIRVEEVVSAQFEVPSEQFSRYRLNSVPGNQGARKQFVKGLPFEYMLMGARSGSDRGFVVANLDVDGQLPPELRDELIFGLARVSGDGTLIELPAPTGTSEFIDGTDSVLISTELQEFGDLRAFEDTYVVVGGRDLDESGWIDSIQEIEIRDTKQIKIISREWYLQSIEEIRRQTTLAQAILPNASNLYRSFIENSVPEGADVPPNPDGRLTELFDFNGSRQLAHHVGIDPRPDSTGVINRFEFSNASPLAEAIREHPAFRLAVNRTVYSRVSEISTQIIERLVESGRQTDRVGPWPLDVTSIELGDEVQCNSFVGALEPDCDLFFALRFVDIAACVDAEVRLSSGSLFVDGVSVSGTIDDIYDFDFGTNTTDPIFAPLGAAVQAGFGQLGDGGQIFRVIVDISDVGEAPDCSSAGSAQ